MMLGWLRPSAILASSTNIATNCRDRANAGWIFLITRVLFSPWATVVLARNTSAMPPVPIFLTSEYLPNCSIPGARSNARWIVADPVLQRRDGEVVEPGVRLPVVEREVLVAGADQRPRVVVLEERRGHVVDVPGHQLALADDPPLVLLAALDPDVGALLELAAVLVAARDHRLRVAPAAEHQDVAGRGVAAAVGVERPAVAEQLDLDVAVGAVRPRDEVDLDVLGQLLAQPQRVVVAALGRQRAVGDLVAAAGLVVVAADLAAAVGVGPRRGHRRRVLDLAAGREDGGGGAEQHGADHGRGPTMASGRTARSNASAESRPSSSTASRRVRLLSWASLAALAAAS